MNKESLSLFLDSLSDCDENLRNTYRGHEAFLDHQYESCTDHLAPLIKNFPEFLPSRLEVAESYLALHKWDFAENEAR